MEFIGEIDNGAAILYRCPRCGEEREINAGWAGLIESGLEELRCDCIASSQIDETSHFKAMLSY